MKFIHTGDWHIGKVVNEFSLVEDQEFVIEQLIEIIKEERPDALVIAGDLYDRSVAPSNAVELLDSIFNRIVLDLNTPILSIAGNHDSPERLGFGGEILKNKGLYIEGVFKRDIEKVVLKDKWGPVNFYLVPYADPAIVKSVLNSEDIKNHDDAMKAIIDVIHGKMNTNERNIAVTHGFVIGNEAPELSESERPLSIGGADYVRAENFKDFNYTALGHLHGPQKVGSEKIRYSGSLLKYSFSEIKQKKSVTIVDIDENGDIKTELRPLIPKRDMRVIKGELNILLDPEVYKGTNVEDYISVILTDEGELLNPIEKLRSVYKNVMLLSRENRNRTSDLKTNSLGNIAKKSKIELFKEFYLDITGMELSEDKETIVSEVILKVEKNKGDMDYETA